ncbi:unnamed protein product (macronuclear) [Paramecium tetraurelia]|uniref:Uncharacterized protein n=1 Tax=Paramecium tetraurelia TaxID=5888 RepID=A0BJW0_PARTE|nr:uncharacterized protein GSPATT00029457001 [Paramecium tetraurelia]CAK58827.1 unnamed protein product [Paramecium tetraurelia]|eukprot:XP_001426225.1 hypothetical protein (macronuclear) [Paramecium tetraurelia strain d4-2]
MNQHNKKRFNIYALFLRIYTICYPLLKIFCFFWVSRLSQTSNPTDGKTQSYFKDLDTHNDYQWDMNASNLFLKIEIFLIVRPKERTRVKWSDEDDLKLRISAYEIRTSGCCQQEEQQEAIQEESKVQNQIAKGKEQQYKHDTLINQSSNNIVRKFDQISTFYSYFQQYESNSNQDTR